MTMTPELWERLKPLFMDAIDIPKEDRTRFLAERCGTGDELNQTLLALLTAHDEESDLYDRPVVNLTNDFERKYLAPDTLLQGRFKIVRLLGKGGMGEVYDAIDLEMGQIALKIIRPEIASNPQILSRFKHEVQVARLLSGPHVCRVHEFEPECSIGDMRSAFLTMEYLDGKTLSDTLHESGPIPWKDAQRIAIEICAGLQTIHEAGIIHRDLKCRNIMLASRGGGPHRAVLMDFGLAREVSGQLAADVDTAMTVPGALVGTPDYMAPEQFEGKKLSPATDIFALGVVLYELVTGSHPFPSSTPIGAAVQRGRAPLPASSIQPGLPRRWDTVISKCLEHRPERRYQSAKEVAEALGGIASRLATLQRNRIKTVAAGSFPVLLFPCLLFVPALRERIQGIIFSSHQKHVAVLPFDVSESDPRTEALSDGLMDSLSDRLSDLDTDNQSLWVVPASEIRSRKVNDASAAWRVFRATIAVKGRVQRNGQGVRLDFAIIDTRNMRQIGSVELEDKSGDLGGLENEAILRISRLINVSETRDQAKDHGRTLAPPAAAFEEYLTAIGYMERYDKAGNLVLAITSLKRAVRMDNNFSLAYAQLGEAYRIKYQLDKNPHWLDEATASCTRASAIGDKTPALFITLAKIHETTGHFDLAMQELQHAIELDPKNAEALDGLANLYESSGRDADAATYYKKAIALRPDYWDGYQELGIFYNTHNRAAEAIVQYQHAIDLTSDNAELYANLGGAYINTGDPKLMPEAERALKKSIELNPTYQACSNLAYLYSIQGKYVEAASAGEKAISLDQNDYEAWATLVTAYEWLGKKDKATVARDRMLPLAQGAVKLNPRNADAHATLATLYAHQRLKDKTNQAIQTAVALAPDDPNILSSVGQAYELLGDRNHAIEYIQLAFQKGFTLAALKGEPDLQGLLKDTNLHVPPK